VNEITSTFHPKIYAKLPPTAKTYCSLNIHRNKLIYKEIPTILEISRIYAANTIGFRNFLKAKKTLYVVSN